MPSINSVTLRKLGYATPDGQTILSDLTGAFSTGRTGLIGANGSGKTTLLKLIAGRLKPDSGEIDTVGEVAWLQQDLALAVHSRVSDLLGVTEKLTALRAIESGSVDPAHFDTLDNDWDFEARARQALAQVGLSALEFERRVAQLSGGEVMLVALAALIVRAAPITLLDEPTNNLDRRARELLYAVVRDWKRTLIVVSHDLDLLELMDQTAELYDSRLTMFGGPYSQWKTALEAQQLAAEQAVQNMKATLAVEKRQRQAAEQAIASRNRQGSSCC